MTTFIYFAYLMMASNYSIVSHILSHWSLNLDMETVSVSTSINSKLGGKGRLQIRWSVTGLWHLQTVEDFCGHFIDMSLSKLIESFDGGNEGYETTHG